MNRLKFRVWDKLEKRFLFPSEGYQGHYILTLNGEFWNLQNGSGGSECVVQQWTGQKDKNGVDIYEGDIVNYNFDGETYPKEAVNKNLVCVYREYNLWFGFTDEPDGDIYKGYYWMEIKDNCEVIGNIFENEY